MRNVGGGMRGKILKMSRYLGIEPPHEDSSREETWAWFHTHIEAYQKVRKEKHEHGNASDRP